MKEIMMEIKFGDILRSVILEANPKLPNYEVDHLIDKYIPLGTHLVGVQNGSR